MSNTELQTLDQLSFNEIAALTGANVRETIVIPRLTVNREPVDEDNKPLPMGAFTVTQNDIKVFGTKAIFRPFINAYQYSEYSPSTNKFVNRSLIIKSFREEALDEKGGLACGKVPFKKLPELNIEEQLRQKNIKCRRLIYGLLSLEDADINELPVLFKLAGGNFMAPNEALASIEKLKHQYFQHNLILKTKQQKKGSTIYYDVLITPVLKESLQLTSDNMDTFRMFQESIDRENNWIAKQWREAKKAAVQELEADPLASLAFDSPTEV